MRPTENPTLNLCGPTIPAAVSHEESFLDSKEVADLIGVRPHTLQMLRWRNLGPPYIKISGTCIRYRRDDIDRLLYECRIAPDAAEERTE